MMGEPSKNQEQPGAASADITFPFITIDRLRMETDGDGVTTLVASKGCPLSCKYCLNKQILNDEVPCRQITPKQLFSMVAIDDLYFRATNGGVVFGGGESLLHARFIREFAGLVPKDWRILAETCLNVPSELLETALPVVDNWIVDIKDMNPEIYRSYTGQDNARVTENLRILAEAGRCDDVVIRLPLIPSFNTDEDRQHSEEAVKAIGPFTKFDRFNYVIR